MVQIEDPKTLSDRIDTNKNNNIETSEIIKFLDKDENVLNLGIILENVFKPRQIWSIDGSQEKAANLIYNAACNATLYNKKFQQKIQNIINKGKGGLGKAEVFLLYIQWHFDGAGGFEELQPIRTKGDLYTRYGGEYLLTYIRRKYKNQKYEFWEGWPNDLLNNPKPIPKSKPTGKDVIPASPKKEIQLPRDISFDMYGEDNTYMRGEFKKLDTWAQKYFLSDYNKAKEASLKRNERKKEKDDYVQLDLFIFALTKYREYVEKQDLTIGKSIFGSQESFYLQKTLAENYLKDLENINKNFPGVGDIIKKLSEYNKELKKIQKKYLGEENEEVVQKKYENYVSAVNQKRKEMGIDKNLCNKEPETSEEAVIFFENMDKIMQFQAEQESIKKTYGEKTINNYENYLNAKGNLTKKYGKDNLQQRINTYNIYKKAVSDCRDKHPGFNVEKYQQYIQELSTSGLLNDFNNLRILSKSLTIKDGNIPNNFPIKSIRDEYEAKKREQAKTDKRWENLKSKSTFLYQVCNIGASALNALRSGTFQLGGKLGALLLSPFFDDDEMVAIWEKTETGARGRHINTSTKQSESLYRDGKITFNWDNGPGIVAESIVNMCLLIEGGGIVGKTVAEGAAKTGINISTKAAQGVGLFTSGFLNNIGTSFQEGFDVGMTGNQALLYATVSSFIQGGLELVSPNEFLLGSGKNLAKSYIKEILKSGNKQSLQAIGKVFLKNVGSEIVEENFQEALQLAAGNLINMRANDQFDLGQISGTETLVADWDPKNFGATAIITTLTTGLVTSGSLAMKTPGMGNTQTREQLISHIQSNPELYQDVTNILDKAIAGNIKIPNVQIQELQNLKRELNVKSINIGNENTDYFDGKPHQFEVTEQQARSNSLNMDNILREINEQNQFEKLQELRENIREQYKKATGENLELTDEQLLSILDAHEQDGIIGELTTGQLKKKVKVLKETVKDSKIRRFLLEAGFCGSEDSDVNLVYMPEDDDVSWVCMPEDDDVSIVEPDDSEINNDGVIIVEPDDSEINNDVNKKKNDVNDDIDNKNEIKRVANIFKEFVDFDVDEYVERHLDIALSGKKEQYIRDILLFVKNNIIDNQSNNKLYSAEANYFYNAKVVDYILSNSKLTLENIKNVLQDKRINIKDIEYVVKKNSNISQENDLIEEIKEFNILLRIENEGDLQKYITGIKHGSDITGDISQYIIGNGLSEHTSHIENRYNGNYNPETQKFTMARDIGNSDFDMQLIQNIINKQNIKPRGLENNSVYDLLNELHNSVQAHDTFILYSKYLLGEDVTSLAGEYSLGSGGGFDNDPALYRHTRMGENGVFEGRKYRIIGEFSPGEIVRSGTIEQVQAETANWGESERITLGEVSSNNVSQIIDLETGKVVYDRNSGYVDSSLKTIIELNDNNIDNDANNNIG